MYEETPPPDSRDPSAELEFRTVGDVVADVKQLLDGNFARVYVAGEISNFKRHASGHCYFVLKDNDAQLRAVIWRATANRLQLLPRDGLQVEIRGRITLFPARGDLQLYVENLRPAGEGAAQLALQELRQRLQREGLFSRDAKKPLPRFPERIGVITSGSGAALHDILKVIGRRYPVATVLVLPVQVQGLGAPESIAEAIRLFADQDLPEHLHCDVLIVGRGGGSAEDLWAFNEEVVARAIFACPIPIVSAVGHESDVTISDFVADVRAATPSHAAELVVPDRFEVAAVIAELRRAMDRSVNDLVQNARQRIDYLLTSYYFKRTLDQVRQLTTRTRELRGRADDAVSRSLQQRRMLLSTLQLRLHRQRTEERIRLLKASTVELIRRMDRALLQGLERRKSGVESLQRELLLSDPQRPLRTGWALVTKDSAVVRSIRQLKPGDGIVVRIADGSANANVDTVNRSMTDPET